MSFNKSTSKMVIADSAKSKDKLTFVVSPRVNNDVSNVVKPNQQNKVNTINDDEMKTSTESAKDLEKGGTPSLKEFYDPNNSRFEGVNSALQQSQPESNPAVNAAPTNDSSSVNKVSMDVEMGVPLSTSINNKGIMFDSKGYPILSSQVKPKVGEVALDSYKPTIDEVSIEKIQYIPLTLAEDSLNLVNSSYHDMKVKYEEYIKDLLAKYHNNTTTMKTHYENYIQSIKQQALTHVINQKRIKNSIEHKLNKANESITSLRVLLSQEKSLTEKNRKIIEDDNTRNIQLTKSYHGAVERNVIEKVCLSTMDEMLTQIEITSYADEYNQSLQNISTQYQQQNNNLQSQLDSKSKEFLLCQSQYNQSNTIHTEVSSCLNNMITKLETNENEIKFQKYLNEIYSLNEMNKVLKEEINQYKEETRLYHEKVEFLESQILLNNNKLTSTKVEMEIDKKEKIEFVNVMTDMKLKVTENTYEKEIEDLKATIKSLQEQQSSSSSVGNSSSSSSSSSREMLKYKSASSRFELESARGNSSTMPSAVAKELDEQTLAILAIGGIHTARKEDSNTNANENKVITNVVVQDNPESLAILNHSVDDLKSILDNLRKVPKSILNSSTAESRVGTVTAVNTNKGPSSPAITATAIVEDSNEIVPFTPRTSRGIESNSENQDNHSITATIYDQVKLLQSYLTELKSMKLRQMQPLGGGVTEAKKLLRAQSKLFSVSETSDETNDANKGTLDNLVPPKLLAAARAKSFRSSSNLSKSNLDHNHATNSTSPNGTPKSTSRFSFLKVISGSSSILTPRSQQQSHDTTALPTYENISSDKLMYDEETVTELVEEATNKLTDEYTLIIEHLEDDIITLRENVKVNSEEMFKLTEKHKILTSNFDTLVKEKRSDVIESLEIEIKKMKQKEESIVSELTDLKMAKLKVDSLAKELHERSERAEKELKMRDEIELKQLEIDEEKKVLKIQIGTQRNEIVMKAKAATSGWNAAADADQRLETEIQKAYKKGLDENDSKKSSEWIALNKSIESKDQRISDLLLGLQSAQSELLQTQEKMEAANKELVKTKLDLQDAMNDFAIQTTLSINKHVKSSTAKSGAATADITSANSKKAGENENDDEEEGGESSEDLKQEVARLKQEKEQSQDEIVNLIEKNENLEEQLKLLEQMGNAYEQVIAEYEETIQQQQHNVFIQQKEALFNATHNEIDSPVVNNRKSSSIEMSSPDGRKSSTTTGASASKNALAPLVVPLDSSALVSDSDTPLLSRENSSENVTSMLVDESTNIRPDSKREVLKAIMNIIKNAATKGAAQWKANNKDACYNTYFSACEDISKHAYFPSQQPALVSSVNSAMKEASAIKGPQAKSKGAVILRKSLDNCLSSCQNLMGSTPNTPRNSVSVGSALNELSGSQNNPNKRNIAQSKTQQSSSMTALKQKISRLDNGKKELEKERIAMSKANSDNTSGNDDHVNDQKLLQDMVQVINGSSSSSSAPTTTTESTAVTSSTDHESSAVLLNRARVAERKLELLMQHLANSVANNTNTGSTATAAPLNISMNQLTAPPSTNETNLSVAVAVGTGATAAIALANKNNTNNSAASVANTAALNMELRKYQRRVKELEEKIIKSEADMKKLQNIPSGGGVPGGVDPKALAALEKNHAKKIKEMETIFRKDKSTLETRVTAAEDELSVVKTQLPVVTQERDDLLLQINELKKQSIELENLRVIAGKAAELETVLKEKEKTYAVLEDSFKKETLLRKKYKNELEDLKGTIRVYARCRPMAKYEIENGSKQVVTLVDDQALKVAGSRGEKAFEFDAAFGPFSTQAQVFEDTKRLVESCIDGFNVCLFAYGQTGSGKTFTMTGTPDMPGLTPAAINELFRLIKEKSHCTIKVSSYFVELYNDNLVDLYLLLDRRATQASNVRKSIGAASAGQFEIPKLDIKMNEKKIVFIQNAVIKENIENAEDLMNLFMQGNTERHTGATKMNAESSRSHSIFSILIESYDKATKKTTFGKLSLVDLAGSERADKTGAAADRMKEAQSINKSLSALGDVIAALSEGEKFIPYRNNKLTQLMQDSLGGNAKTLMFVNFSPADYNADETISSLNYAQRVKKITNNAAKQAESEEVARLKAMIAKLQKGGAGSSSLENLADMNGGNDAEAEEEFYRKRNLQRAEEGDDAVVFDSPAPDVSGK